MPSGFPAFPSAPSNPLGKKVEAGADSKSSPPPLRYRDDPRGSSSEEALLKEVGGEKEIVEKEGKGNDGEGKGK